MSTAALCISGGGIRGLLIVGALKALEDAYGPLTIIFSQFSGSSAGAIIALLISIGYTTSEIWDLAFNLSGSDITDVNLKTFLEQKSINTGIKIKQWLTRLLEDKGYNEHTRFRDLYYDLTVCAVSLDTRRPEYFSKHTTPNINVITAVLASAALPFVFPPVYIQGTWYIDGALLDNTPSASLSADTILYLRIKNRSKKRNLSSDFEPSVSTLSFLKYLSLVLEGLIWNAKRSYKPGNLVESNINYIEIDYYPVNNWKSKMYEFEVPMDAKFTMLMRGQKQMEKYIFGKKISLY